MREISFRGYSPTAKQWAYGNCLEQDKENNTYLIAEKKGGMYVSHGYHDVERKTIGLFTGCEDRDGNEIYEGDILVGEDYPYMDDQGNVNYYTVVEPGTMMLTFHKAKGSTVQGLSEWNTEEMDYDSCKRLEIVGNITQNANLLEYNYWDEDESD